MNKHNTTRAKPQERQHTVFLRVAGTDLPAVAVVRAATERGDLPLTFTTIADRADDYCLVDRSLAVASQLPPNIPPPESGLGYAGFSAVQRGALHAWIEHPETPAPPAFQQFLLANAEVRLLEGSEHAERAHTALLAISAAPPWHGHGGLARTLLLSFWLRQDGAGLAQWLASFALPAALWQHALGLQALLAQPLHPDELPPLASAWSLPAPDVAPGVLRLRLDSLGATLAQEPLAYSLAKLGEEERTPKPWRCFHRDLRLALPQPNLRRPLEPLLRDLLAVVEPAPPPTPTPPPDEPPAAEAATDAPPTDKRTKKRKTSRGEAEDKPFLILEFGASRSDVFDYVLRLAQKQPGFLQIMDENRHMVYRVPFRRSDMRHFWQIWGYVQNWASTHVYSGGRELDRWQVYPYSQYLR